MSDPILVSEEEFAALKNQSDEAKNKHAEEIRAAHDREPKLPHREPWQVPSFPQAKARPLTIAEMEREELLAHEAKERQQAWDRGAPERLRQAREHIANDVIPAAFRWASFAHPRILNARVQSAHAVEVALGLDGIERAVFVGSSGTGKTSLAAAAARKVIWQGAESVRFESSFRLSLARSRHPLGEGEPATVEQAMNAGLLVLDELGSDELVHGSCIKEMIYERHWRARATWITTWMSPEEVGAKYGDGVARRIFDGAIIIECGR